ncbi:MAG: tetratricopeptide repeat protein, partial [Betaproteobacteria bacterium]
MTRTQKRARARILFSLAAPPAFICALLTPLTVLADPALLHDAKQLLAADNPKQAFMILVAKQDKLAGDPDFDYLLGVSALDSGKIDEAIIAFERVLQVKPTRADARMDLSRAYFNAGSMDLAEANFLELKSSNPPPTTLAVIDKYLAAIRDRRAQNATGLLAWGETGLGYDSN